MLNYFLSTIWLNGAKTTGCSGYFTFDERLSSLWVGRMPATDRMTDLRECRGLVEAHCCLPVWGVRCTYNGRGTMRLSAFVRPAAAVVLLFAFTSTDVIAKGKHRSCAQLQAMKDNALTGGKHAGDGTDKRAKIERKMRKKGC